MSSIETTSRPVRSVRDHFAELFRKGEVSRKAVEEISGNGNGIVTASDWQLVLNTNNDTVSLSCTLAANNSDNLIVTAGLLLSDNSGNTLGTFYLSTFDNGLSTGSCQPSLTIPQGSLSEGSTVNALVMGMLAGGQFFNPSTPVTVTGQ